RVTGDAGPIRVDGHSTAGAARVHLIGEQDAGGGDIWLGRGAIRIGRQETPPGAELCPARVGVEQREYAGVIADTRAVEGVAVLCAEIVAVIQRKRSEPVPVRTGGEGAVEGAPGGQDRLRPRAERRVGLIAKSGQRKAGELIRRQLAVENSDVPLRLL